MKFITKILTRIDRRIATVAAVDLGDAEYCQNAAPTFSAFYRTGINRKPSRKQCLNFIELYKDNFTHRQEIERLQKNWLLKFN